MQRNNDDNAVERNTSGDGSESSENADLEWLIEQEYAEEPEKLFALLEEELDCSLSPLEAEIAARPMMSGDRNLDDLSTYVREEIVLGSGDTGSDIYAKSDATGDPGEVSHDVPMAIDHSKSRSGDEESITAVIDDGVDILGLAEEDDIGEQFLVIKKGQAEAATARESVEQSSIQIVGGDDHPEQQDTHAPEDTVPGLPFAGAAGDIVSGAVDATSAVTGSAADTVHEAQAGTGSLAEMAAGLAGPEALVNDLQPGLEGIPEAAQEATDNAPGAFNLDAETDIVSEAVADFQTGGEDTQLDAFAVSAIDKSETDRSQAAPDVVEYVSQTEPPTDDAAFDQYLLDGEHLAGDQLQIEELKVEDTDGVASVDPSPVCPIDYEDDFDVEAGLDGSSIAAISRVIDNAMEGLSARVRERLEVLGLPVATVEVELMLGADAESVACCLAQGYVRIATISDEEVPGLEALGQTERDAVYVRLLNVASGEAWNNLFDESFSGHLEETTNAVGDIAEMIPWSASAGLDEAESGELEDDSGFAEELGDLVIEGFDDELSDDDLLEEAMTSLSGFSADNTADADATVPPTAIEDELIDSGWGLAEVDAGGVEESTATGVEVLAGAATEPATDEAADEAESPMAEDHGETVAPAVEDDMNLAAEVVEEDIFGPDFADEFEPVASDSSTDVDFLLSGLAENEKESDDICGIAVDEFDTAAGVEMAVTEQETVSAPDDSGMSWCIPSHIKFDRSSQSQGEIFADFLDAFIEEAASGLEQLEDAMAAWEEAIDSDAAFAPIPRILHTLKGIAKGVGLQRYGTLIHNYETLLEGLARPAAGAEVDYFRILNVWLDAAVSGFEHIQAERSDIASEFPTRGAGVPIAGIEEPAEDAIAVGDQSTMESDTTGSEADAPSLPANVVPIEEAGGRNAGARQKDMQLADEGAKVLAAKQSIRMTPESLDHLLNLTSQAQQLGVRSSQATLRNKGAAAELQGRLSSVRAHIAKIADRALRNVTSKGSQSTELDALEMDQYSELQEAANILREGVEDLDDLINHSSRQNAQVEALLKQQASVISLLGSSIQAARVVPVSRLMPGLRRIVRTVSTDLGKAVQFRVLNEVGSLDRDNHARCQVILEHMVRNALDHGIETPAERIAAGKPTAGRITIDVNKHGSDYVIELNDDGRGIDPDVMRETAFDKGLDVDVDALSDSEAQHLIFHKGFSTAETLSEISGRGVGMDIVISELQQIGGDIDIESVVGEGTTFRVRIPSNLILNGALLVSAGRASYAVPLDGLIAVEHVGTDAFYDAVENKRSLEIFGMECEPSYLATLCHGEGLPERGTWGSTLPVIVAGSEERYMAVAIDDVKEALELVIRSLGVQFSMVPGVTGAATTADGQAIVALDLNALVASLELDERSTISVEHKSDENMLVLVVDDSRTQRLVATSRFDTLGVETVTAENGMVAMEFLNSTHRLPDVVLLDVEMPVKDGIQTLRDIRMSARLRDLPVIMVTSRTGVKHRKLAEDAGCNGYMGKPFNFPVLVEMIAELTNRELQMA